MTCHGTRTSNAMTVASRIIHRLKPKPRQYTSYDEALAKCDGYEDADIVGTVYAKTVANRSLPLTSTNAFTLLSLLVGGRRVLDFGGACGIEYFNARRLLPASQKLEWTVVETPAMVARAAPLANAELRFATSIDGLRPDVVHTSGTLQCVDDPLDHLQRLVDIGAEHMVFNRLGLSLGGQVVTIHESRLSENGPGPMPAGMPDRLVRYPFVFPSREAFLGILTQRYDVAATFADDSGVFRVRGARLVGGGMVARLKA